MQPLAAMLQHFGTKQAHAGLFTTGRGWAQPGTEGWVAPQAPDTRLVG